MGGVAGQGLQLMNDTKIYYAVWHTTLTHFSTVLEAD
jgi:hypothetical protein